MRYIPSEQELDTAQEQALADDLSMECDKALNTACDVAPLVFAAMAEEAFRVRQLELPF